MKHHLVRLRWTISSLGYYIIAQLLLLFGQYDRAYCCGRWFVAPISRIYAKGWQWIVLDWYRCRKMHRNLDVRFPVSPLIQITGSNNISFHPDDLNIFQNIGNYYQGIGSIRIGHGTNIAMNVGIITSNHDVMNPECHTMQKPVSIGNNCWIGMNAMILPGVELGDFTTVGAGSVVTRSFLDGYCIIAGNPAKLIRKLR